MKTLATLLATLLLSTAVGVGLGCRAGDGSNDAGTQYYPDGGAKPPDDGGSQPPDDGGQQPPTDAGTLLTVGCWNLDWFGYPTSEFGPSDKTLQYNNVLAVMQGLPQVDMWGLEEVVSEDEFNNLKSALGMEGILGNEVTGGSGYYSVDEQKVGLLFRASKVALRGSAQLILTSASYSDFAGRPPLEVPVTLKKPDGSTLDAYVIVLHMKADATSDGYNERLAASADLKAYLASTHPSDAVFVIGDWNDDINHSTYKVGGTYQASPYANFEADSTHMKYATQALTDSGQHSTTSFSSVIDHQLITAPLFGAFVSGSATIEHPATSKYSSTTSDHYPVHTAYALGGAGPAPAPTLSADVFINEVMPYETTSGVFATEFVELVNHGAATVNLSGWKLTSANKYFYLPAGTQLTAGAALAVFNDAGGIPAGLENAIGATGYMNLDNAGTTVALYAADGGQVDAMSYSSVSQRGLSYNRSPDGMADGTWVAHNTLSASLASPGKRVDAGAF